MYMCMRARARACIREITIYAVGNGEWVSSAMGGIASLKSLLPGLSHFTGTIFFVVGRSMYIIYMSG